MKAALIPTWLQEFEKEAGYMPTNIKGESKMQKKIVLLIILVGLFLLSLLVVATCVGMFS